MKKENDEITDLFRTRLADAGMNVRDGFWEEGEDYVLTYKSKGLMVREEYNLPLTKESYEHLLEKADGTVITKTRYRIPEKNGLTIELDVFHGRYGGLFLAEVEFATEEEANSYCPPEWFGEDVTMSSAYHNSTLSQKK